ncbi:MAG: hypothetical protein OEV08_00860 [Nitrospira sp.]|nr:hypothetical protein [Nitrospira sp.]
MGGLFGGEGGGLPATPSRPERPPSMADQAIREAADAAAKNRLKQGRASTFLTNPQSQRKAEESGQTYLTGA